MSDQEQRDRNDERVEDLEVRGDEAREIAGGAVKKGKAAKKGGLGRAAAKADAKRFDARQS